MSNIDRHPRCHMRTSLGNCDPLGGFCTSVNELICEALHKASRSQEWIPCSERLPEDGRYLVTRDDFVTNTYFLDILWYEKGVWWNRLYTGDFSVIAWMPLPKAYAERKK